MTSYDKRMEESEQKLQSRLEDFEAERRDAELAFKVKIRDSYVCVINFSCFKHPNYINYTI